MSSELEKIIAGAAHRWIWGPEVNSVGDAILTEIKDYIDANGGEYPSWYAGITNDPRHRVFDDHCVLRQGGLWIYRPTPSKDVAAAVEKYLIDVLGLDGGTGGGDSDSNFVYAYKKTVYTMP